MKIHSLIQPHFRLVYLFLWGLMISALKDISWLLILNGSAILLLGGMILYHQKSFVPYIRRWISLLIFIALIWATLSWKIGENGILLSPHGIQLAELLSLRMNLLLFSLWIFLWNINDAVLVQAFGKLPLPQKLVQLFVLTIRYIALLGEIRQKMDIAMRARGYQATLNRRTLYVTAQSVSLLLIHALLKAEMSQIALKCRGFQFGKKEG